MVKSSESCSPIDGDEIPEKNNKLWRTRIQPSPSLSLPVKDWKNQMLDYQSLKGWKGIFFPLFPSQDPPTALRSASENRLMIKRYMQGECTVIKLTCVDESERLSGFIHTIPGIMRCVKVVQTNNVINATAAASEWRRSRRYVLQAAVSTS